MRTRTKGTIAAVVVVVLLLLGLIVVQSALACRCTPGFWKNHTELWERCDAGGLAFRPDQTLGEAGFAAPNLDDTLLDALRYGGGLGFEGAARNLLRAGVAAALNEQCHYLWWDTTYPDAWPIEWPPFYGRTTVEVVNEALGTGDRDIILDLYEQLDDWNNFTCKEPCDTWPDCPNEPIE